MRIITQIVGWIFFPALATLLTVSVYQAASTYQPTITGHAHMSAPAGCVTDPDEFFDNCAVLDTTQVQDLRTDHTRSTELEIR
jgi:hypothetical protein